MRQDKLRKLKKGEKGDMVCCLLSEWCVAASFYQRTTNLVLLFAQLIVPYHKNTAPIFVGSGALRKVDSPLNCCVFVCSC